MKKLDQVLADLEKKSFGTLLLEGKPREFNGVIRKINNIIQQGLRQIQIREKEIQHLSETKDKLRESMNEMLTLQKLSDAISSTHQIDKILNLLVTLSQTVVEIEGCGVFLIGKEDSMLKSIMLKRISPEVQKKIASQLDEGIVDWVIKERRPTVVPDFLTQEGGEKTTEKNFIIIPLIVRDKGIGVFEIYSSISRKEITFQDLELLSLLANHTAVAIENSRLYQEMNTYIQDLSTLFEMGNKITAKLDFKELQSLIIRSAVKLLNAEVGFLIISNKEKFDFDFFSTSGKSIRLSKKTFNSEVIDLLNHEKKPFLIAAHKGKRYEAVLNHFKAKVLVCVPLIHENRGIGFMIVGSVKEDRVFYDKDITLLTTLANQALVALVNAMLFEEVIKANQTLQEVQLQLIQKEKLASIGELAGGVAHEINNPLQIILGRIQLVLAEVPKTLKSHLSIVESETKRIATIVRGLLDFSRGGASEPSFEKINLNEVVERAILLTHHQLKLDRIEIHLSLHKKLPLVSGDANQLSQVFLNLIQNARQAIKNKGRLSIFSGLKDNFVFVDFVDNGIGIREENLKKIFDPFFTTKEMGEGTGLGLSISYRIIEKHHGKLIVESRYLKGSKFSVLLPVWSRN